MSSIDSARFIDTLRGFAATLVTGFDLSDVLTRLCHAVVENLPVSGVGVAVANEREDLRFAAATDDRIRHLEVLQEQAGAGPCTTAFAKGKPVVVDDLETTEDWPSFRHAALAAGLRTVIALPMRIEDQRVGVLDPLGAARRFADMATSYVLNVREERRSEETARQLQYGLSHRVVVEQGQGTAGGTARDLD